MHPQLTSRKNKLSNSTAKLRRSFWVPKMGDLNSKVGAESTPNIVWKYGQGETNHAEHRLIQTFQRRGLQQSKHLLPITQKKIIHMQITNWYRGQDSKKSNWRFRKTITSAKIYPSAHVAANHNLICV